MPTTITTHTKPILRPPRRRRRGRLLLESPNGGYVGEVPIVVGWLEPTTAPAASVPGLPELHFDPNQAFPLFDPNHAPGPFGPITLPASGLGLGGPIPFGLWGNSIIIQGIALAPSPKTGDPLFTATVAHEMVLLQSQAPHDIGRSRPRSAHGGAERHPADESTEGVRAEAQPAVPAPTRGTG